VVEAEVDNDRLAQVSACEVRRPSQIGGRQACTGHVGIAEGRPSQIGRCQINPSSGALLVHCANRAIGLARAARESFNSNSTNDSQSANVISGLARFDSRPLDSKTSAACPRTSTEVRFSLKIGTLDLGVFQWTNPNVAKMVVRPIAKLSREARRGQTQSGRCLDAWRQPYKEITTRALKRLNNVVEVLFHEINSISVKTVKEDMHADRVRRRRAENSRSWVTTTAFLAWA
jgi:hypothetical protein